MHSLSTQDIYYFRTKEEAEKILAPYEEHCNRKNGFIGEGWYHLNYVENEIEPLKEFIDYIIRKIKSYGYKIERFKEMIEYIKQKIIDGPPK